MCTRILKTVDMRERRPKMCDLSNEIEDVLIDFFEILHYSEKAYEELKEKAQGFMVRIKMYKANKEGK